MTHPVTAQPARPNRLIPGPANQLLTHQVNPYTDMPMTAKENAMNNFQKHAPVQAWMAHNGLKGLEGLEDTHGK